MTNDVKKVPELRFPEFDGDWEELRIGQLAEIVRGSSPRPISDPKWFDSKSEIGWLRISDVTKQNGRITNLEQRISVDGQNKTRVLYSEHLLLSIAATVGKPVINYVKTGVHDGFLIFLNPLFDIEYMFQWLDAFRPKWKKYGQPGSQVNLNSELVRSQKIVIPDTVEQKRIGEFFSKLDQQIELEEQKLAKLEEQKKGYMQKVFSQELRFKDENGNDYDEWKEEKLENIADFQNGKAHENLVSIEGEYVLVNSKFISTDTRIKKHVSQQLTPLNKEDIAIVMSDIPNGKALAKCFLVDENNKYSLNQRIGRIYNILGDSRFLYLILNRNKQLLKYDSGVGQTNLKKSEITDILLNWPIKEEQQKIGDFFRKIDELIEKQSEKIEVLNMRKKGFLQKMFV